MKVRRSAAAAALAASGTYAQTTPGAYLPESSPTSSSTGSTSYLTVTYDDCSSMPMETMITVTNGVTITYCPECEMQASSKPAGPGYTTTYTTTYMSLCPTGVVPATYTVTESCTDATPTWTMGPSHIPNGFTVTTKECTVCDKATPTVTITEPCGCDATNGVPATNTAAMTTPAGGSAPAASAPACDGEDCGGSGSQSPGGGSPAGSSPEGSSPAGGSPGAAPSGGRTPECDGEDCGGSGSQSPSGSSPGGSSPGGSSPAGGSPAGGSPAGSSPAAAPSGGSSTPECNGEDCGGSGSQSPSGSTPGAASPSGGSTPECDGADCGGSAGMSPSAGSTGGSAMPYSTTTMASCPGPNCRAVASSSPSGVSYGNTSGIVPSPGAAAGLSTNLFATLAVAVLSVAGFAFML
ncbi:hypothetical protein B0A50_05584 [Salinomyces thailandicus]|uniref:Uncharacterized protein n=1 Tax=Salinomyces thailandicus TaxID=706561 RepID=A0A4V5N415_9PEZI|nr:hypothetical protein B0A50_05584 [Salinomyces thailandica]